MTWRRALGLTVLAVAAMMGAAAGARWLYATSEARTAPPANLVATNPVAVAPVEPPAPAVPADAAATGHPVTLEVAGMSCQACVTKVEHELA